MADLEPIPYSDAKIRSILERVKTIALVGASANWNRPELLRDEVPAGQRLSGDPGQSGHRRQDLLGEKVYASLRDIPDKVDMVDVFRRPRRGRPDRRRTRSPSAPRSCGCSSAFATTQPRRRRGGRRPRSDHEPLPEDRVRAARRRIVVERRQQRHHPEPPARRRRCSAGPSPARLPSANLNYGFETRAIHAGAAPDPTTGARSTPIYQTTAYVFDDVDHAASLFNLHNFGYIYSRLTNPTVVGAGRAHRRARRRPRRGRRRLRGMRRSS